MAPALSVARPMGREALARGFHRPTGPRSGREGGAPSCRKRRLLYVWVLPGTLHVWASARSKHRSREDVVSTRLLRFAAIAAIYQALLAFPLYYLWTQVVYHRLTQGGGDQFWNQLPKGDPFPAWFWFATVGYVALPLAVGTLLGRHGSRHLVNASLEHGLEEERSGQRPRQARVIAKSLRFEDRTGHRGRGGAVRGAPMPAPVFREIRLDEADSNVDGLRLG